jgi:hypothetical protein
MVVLAPIECSKQNSTEFLTMYVTMESQTSETDEETQIERHITLTKRTSIRSLCSNNTFIASLDRMNFID